MYYIHNPQNECVGSVTEPEAAALLAEFYGDESTIRTIGNRVLFTQGMEGTTASDSYDDCVDIIMAREEE